MSPRNLFILQQCTLACLPLIVNESTPYAQMKTLITTMLPVNFPATLVDTNRVICAGDRQSMTVAVVTAFVCAMLKNTDKSVRFWIPNPRDIPGLTEEQRNRLTHTNEPLTGTAPADLLVVVENVLMDSVDVDYLTTYAGPLIVLNNSQSDLDNTHNFSTRGL